MQKKLVSIIITTLLLVIPVITFASSLNDKKNQIQSNITNAKEEQNEIKNEINQAKSELDKLNDQITEKEYEVEQIKEELDTLNAEVDKLSEDLKTSEAEYEEKHDKLLKRLAAQQKRGNVSYLDVLLNSKNLTDFISRYHIMEKMAELDSKMMDDIKEEQKKISNTKAEVEKKQSEVAEKHKQLENEEMALKANRIKKNKYVSQLSAEEQALQKEIEQFNKDLKKVEDQILEEIRASMGNGGPYTGGKILWPIGGGGGRISSYFGYRGSAATGGVGTANHNGYDIAAPHNTPLVASEAGTVRKVVRACSHDYPKTYKTKCNCGGGYGNYLIIDHGGNLQTLYGHCASISVNVGQTVSKGQTIGAVGSAGWSTGYHVHFSVIDHGKYVDPGKYLSK